MSALSDNPQHYAQARLWLGISCVGATTLLAAYLLIIKFPSSTLNTNVNWSVRDLIEISGLFVAWTVFLIPFDIYGGRLIPQSFRQPQFQTSLTSWLKGITLQGAIFVSTATMFLSVGREFGVLGTMVLLLTLQLFYLCTQPLLLQSLTRGLREFEAQALNSIKLQLNDYGYQSPQLLVADHGDQGFTGGIVGLPGREQIVIPRVWISRLSNAELAAITARRIEACRSGSRSLGLMIAIAWNTVGFCFATFLPGAGVQSVAELAATCLGFTIWTFLGLLILPTFSRNSTLAIDRRVASRGVPQEILQNAFRVIHQLQSEANSRSRSVETIFYPVPSLQNRLGADAAKSSWGAWHVARNMLFLSWAGMGFLSRAVHCNCGRPELWVMLPTD